MKKKFRFEKLSISKNGSSTLLTIFLITGILIFMVLPLTAILFEKIMLSLLFEALETSIEINAYQIYQSLEIDDLSQGLLKLSEGTLSDIEALLTPLMEHPQLHSLSLLSISHENKDVLLRGTMGLKPTLYRRMYNFDGEYAFSYYLELPMDKK